ncbi:hypothetical protein DXG01_014142, partial [Tephrocybe rancida]
SSTGTHVDDGHTSSNGDSLSSGGYVYDDFVVPDSFDEADHSDASNIAHRALVDVPAHARRIASKMIVDDDSSDGEASLPPPDSPQPTTKSSAINLPPAHANQPANNEDDDDSEINILDLPVMLEKLQDADLREQGFYDNLPFLERRAFIDSYGYDKSLGDTPHNTIQVSRIKSRMTEENM